MKKNKIKVFITMLGIVLSLGSNVVSAADKNSSTLTVSPPNQEIILVPGEVYEGAIVVANSNEADRDLVYSVSVGSFSQKRNDNSNDDYGTVDIETVSSYNQMMDWIVLGKEHGTVAPNSQDTIPFNIIVPVNAPAGGQYATIAIQDDTKLDNGSGNINIESKVRIASIIYAEVAGETHEEGSIIENQLPTLLLKNTVDATSLVKNEGNVHTDAKYILQVWPLFFDEEICTNEENVTTSLIMPETERYHIETCNLPAIGIFRAKQTVQIFGETSIVEKIIIVCPLWLLVIIVLLIVSIIMWLIMKVKARKQNK